MEIDNNLQKLSWQTRVFFILACMFFYGTMLFFLSIFFEFMNQELHSIIFQAVLFGVFFGIGFPYIVERNSVESIKLIVKKKQPDLEFNEKIELKSYANLFVNTEVIDGKLFLTSEKIIFKSYRNDLQNKQNNIYYTDISKITPDITGRLNLYGLSIETHKGEKFDLVINDREKWIVELNKKIT